MNFHFTTHNAQVVAMPVKPKPAFKRDVEELRCTVEDMVAFVLDFDARVKKIEQVDRNILLLKWLIGGLAAAQAAALVLR